MFDDALNSLYSEVAESISGPQSDRVTQQDVQALAQMVQQIPQMIPNNDPTPVLNGLLMQIASLAQELRKTQDRLTRLENTQPTASDVYSPILDEMSKTKTKTVVFEVQSDQYGFPEKVIAKEKVQK